jgi:murein DD-endopeptidase MepM/ murein hydrolase activator NlpD
MLQEVARGFWFSLNLCSLLMLSGCATVPRSPSVIAAGEALVPVAPGVYHRVEKGQTLWRISKLYGVDIDELAKVNKIIDTARLETNQQLFIPKSSKDSYVFSGVEEDFAWPLKGRVLALFGQSVSGEVNKGINIAPAGADAVLASRSGKVVFYHDDFLNLGKTIILDHGDGFMTVYGRNASVKVSLGDFVNQGFKIATVGSAGRDKKTYLHFQIRKGAVSQNPYFYLAH